MDLAERRARCLELFESWLDRAFAEDGPPAGIDARILAEVEAEETSAPESDLYSLFEALTALTQEVKLQGRAFKDLAGGVGPLLERLDGLAARHEAALSEARDIASEALETARDAEAARIEETANRCFRESVDLLLDLRDRLERGVAAAEALLVEAPARRRGFLARLLRKQDGEAWRATAVSALLRGHRLTLDHLEDALRARGVSVIECEGWPFDPERMSAVDVVETLERPDGAVVEVYRSGYEWNGEVLRAAQVKVARRPARGVS